MSGDDPVVGVPVDLDVEDRLAGPVTFRMAAWFAVAAGGAGLILAEPDRPLVVITGMLLAFVGAVGAWWRPGGRPASAWLLPDVALPPPTRRGDRAPASAPAPAEVAVPRPGEPRDPVPANLEEDDAAPLFTSGARRPRRAVVLAAVLVAVALFRHRRCHGRALAGGRRPTAACSGGARLRERRLRRFLSRSSRCRCWTRSGGGRRMAMPASTASADGVVVRQLDCVPTYQLRDAAGRQSLLDEWTGVIVGLDAATQVWHGARACRAASGAGAAGELARRLAAGASARQTLLIGSQSQASCRRPRGVMFEARHHVTLDTGRYGRVLALTGWPPR